MAVRVRFPRLELQPDRRNHRLIESWSYEWDHGGKTREFHVAAGFVTDLGSIPRPLWGLIAPAELTEGALAHDLVYRYAGRVPGRFFLIEGEPCSTPWTREDADRLFARLLRESGVVRWKRRSAYRAVRLAGWLPWRRAERRILGRRR